jgi:hypothetical protein
MYWKSYAIAAVWAAALLSSYKGLKEPVFYYALWATFWICFIGQ